MVKKKDVDKAFQDNHSIAKQWEAEAEGMTGGGHYTDLPPKLRKAHEDAIKAANAFNAKKKKKK